MANEVIKIDEKDMILNDILQDLERQKEVSRNLGERLDQLEGTVNDFLEKMDGQQPALTSLVNIEERDPAAVDMAPLLSAIRQGLGEIKGELRKQHFQVFKTKYYSLFGDRYGADHFKTVMDTAMKWLIILIVTLSIISVLKFLIHYK